MGGWGGDLGDEVSTGYAVCLVGGRRDSHLRLKANIPTNLMLLLSIEYLGQSYMLYLTFHRFTVIWYK